MSEASDVRAWVLAVDFGTTATAAVTVSGGQVWPLALDGAGRMSSSVYAAPDGALLVGEQADHSAGYGLHRFEPTPKRRIDRPWVRLGGTRYTPAELIAAIMRRVFADAVLQHDGEAPESFVLTHPVAWSPDQRAVVGAAALAAAQELGVVLPDPVFVPEPVAAAHWYARDSHHDPPQPGQRVAIYDLGGGTFDVAVLERTAEGFAVLASGGIDPLGGFDFDHRLFIYLGDRHIGPVNPGLWQVLQNPDPADVETGERRRRMQVSMRLLKETFSTEMSTEVQLPGVSGTVLVTRDEFEGLIAADVARTVDELTETLADQDLTPKDLTAIYRIGGASRTPLVGQRLEALHVPVRTLDDPKLVVALGASVIPNSHPAPPPPTQKPPEPVATAAAFADPPEPTTAVHAFAAQPHATTTSTTNAGQHVDKKIDDRKPADKPTLPAAKAGSSRVKMWMGFAIGTVLVVAAVVVSIRVTSHSSSDSAGSTTPSTTSTTTSSAATTPPPAPRVVVTWPNSAPGDNDLINTAAIGECIGRIGRLPVTTPCERSGALKVIRRTKNLNDCAPNELPLQATDTKTIACVLKTP